MKSYPSIKVKTVGGSPTASHFLLLRQKKVTKEKATPACRPFGVPCVARLVRRLRNSRYALRQSSPTTPDQSPLLGGAQGKERQRRFCVRFAHDCFVVLARRALPASLVLGFCF